jgi:AraC-like DNA-binding protein/putative methionine-R-sulfoxide reductase with GAF domain
VDSLFSAFIQTTQRSAFESNPQKVVEGLCSFLYKHLGLEDLVVYTLSGHDSLIQGMAFGKKGGNNPSIVKKPMLLRFGEGIVGSVALNKKTRYEKNVTECADYISDHGSCLSELSVPVVYRGKLVGVLDSEHTELNFFHLTHARLFQLTACILSPLLYELVRKKNLSPQERYTELKKLLVEKELFLQHDLSKKTLSNLMGISPSYLSRVISLFSQQSFRDIVNELRIKKAQDLLKQPSETDSISAIYTQVGFSSRSTFNRSFKKYTGLTPKAFQKNRLIF